MAAAKNVKSKAKAVFSSPFNLQWPILSAEHQMYITDLISKTFSDKGRERRQMETVKNQRRGAALKRQRQEDEAKATSKQNIQRTEAIDNPPSKKRRTIPETNGHEKTRLKIASTEDPGPIPPPPDFQGIVTGINACTRALEKAELALVVVSRDVQPPLLVQHLPVLCYRSNATLVPLSQGSTVLGPIFGLKRLAAFGVKKGAAGYETFCQQCTEIVPALSIPWIPKLPTKPLTSADNTSEAKQQTLEQEKSAGVSLLPLNFRTMSTTTAIKPQRQQKQQDNTNALKKKKKQKL